MPERPLSAVVLAAGMGSRMHSERPKPLHALCGRPMVVHVLHALDSLTVDWAVLVVGHGAERVVKLVNDAAPSQWSLHYVEQPEQNGTGDAVSIALSALPEHLSDEAEDADLIVLPGDTPLLRPETLEALVDQHRQTQAAATVLTVRVEDPTGYGRVIRDRHGRVRRIVEEADASPVEAAVDEINTSVYCFRTSLLGPALRRINAANAQGEYYLTDVIHVLAEAGHPVETIVADDPSEAAGVNDRFQLALAETELRRRINGRWMRAGVTMIDPASTYIDIDAQLSPDVLLYPNVFLQGTTSVGRGAEVGPESRLLDCAVGDFARVERTEGRMATVGARAQVGPFVVLRPGAMIEEAALIEPFTTVGTDEE